MICTLITDESDPVWERPYFRVSIDPSFGLGGTFHTVYPEIVSAIPCDEKGHVQSPTKSLERTTGSDERPG